MVRQAASQVNTRARGRVRGQSVSPPPSGGSGPSSPNRTGIPETIPAAPVPPTVPAAQVPPSPPPVTGLSDAMAIFANMLQTSQQQQFAIMQQIVQQQQDQQRQFMVEMAAQQQQFVTVITNLTARIAPEGPGAPPAVLPAFETNIGKVMERFQKQKPPNYWGSEVKVDAMAPARWIAEVERIFKVMVLTEAQKVSLAAQVLKGAAISWWEATESTMVARDPNLTWERFKTEFFNNYYPASMREAKVAEYRELVQGDSSVLDYQIKFEELFYFAPEYERAEPLKAKKFQDGLQPHISNVLVCHDLQRYADVVEKAKRIEDNWKEGKIREERALGKRAVPFQDSQVPPKIIRGPDVPVDQSQCPQYVSSASMLQLAQLAQYLQNGQSFCKICKQLGHRARNCPAKIAPTGYPQPPNQPNSVQGQVYAPGVTVGRILISLY